MDIPRAAPRRNYRWVVGVVLAMAAVAATVALGRLRSAAPTLDRAGVWIDTVKRGPMLREVKGPGTLVPEHIRWITAETAGRVERIELRPGAAVKPDAMMIELTNPDVMLQALEAERQLASAQADLIQLQSTLETSRLAQQSALATLKAERSDADRRAKANRELAGKNYIADADVKQTEDRAEELTSREKLESQRLTVISESAKAQIAAQRAQVERLRAVSDFRKKQVESMKVKAGEDGVLSELNLELGQWVVPGTVMAKVVQPGKLKAELRIPETQARDISVGQKVSIDTRNGIVPGHVVRIAPAASQGTVLVEVGLEGELPKGARPDLNVEGTIELERLDNVLFTGRPAGAQPDAQVELYRLVPEDDHAERIKVRLGRSSVSTIEVVDGLKEGDRVILSDMSSWDNADRVRLR